MQRKIWILLAVLFALQPCLKAQIIGGDDIERVLGRTPNAISTAVPFLSLSPDARSAGMGDIGVATTVDLNSQHYNAAKYPYMKDDFGFSLTYSPWLINLVPDMSLAYLTGAFKFKDDRSAIAFSLLYFSMGTVRFTSENPNDPQFAPFCVAVRQVAEHLKKNEQNLFNMMSNKISTIQALLESRCMYAESYRDLGSQDFSALMENVANTTKTDVTIYTPGGKVYKSTSPEIFDRMIIGSRIDKDAYYNIKYRNQRFYIHKEYLAGHRYYALYSPLFNAEGNMVAILSSPYVDTSYDFTRDALFHAATIVNLFFILLAVTLLISTTIVNSMFRPLIEMGKKMNSADLHGLEYIIYRQDDEISGLVDAYNRMVHDLSDSSRQLAQAERDKAWSEMARQVAHEIKNPLTPIKLEIQRLIRLKQKNDPAWNDKFDKVAAVVLEHIDILTDTANEFSTFAKLYSEAPVLMDLDKTLTDQLVIFDNKENIEISYLGMEDAMVMAPRPQLIRVFVNLITNAIQAIEIQQKEEFEEGGAYRRGMIQICLRNSMKDGYYDIVFEDNGPGVKDENLGKLFTPNFTTKSAGTGLGLAICRNIVEKCNGEIMYQRSFVLKGACFTVRLPKYTG